MRNPSLLAGTLLSLAIAGAAHAQTGDGGWRGQCDTHRMIGSSIAADAKSVCGQTLLADPVSQEVTRTLSA